MERIELELDREEDGRHIADVTSVPGCMAYGKTREEAAIKAVALALSVTKDRGDHLPTEGRECDHLPTEGRE